MQGGESSASQQRDAKAKRNTIDALRAQIAELEHAPQGEAVTAPSRRTAIVDAAEDDLCGRLDNRNAVKVGISAVGSLGCEDGIWDGCSATAASVLSGGFGSADRQEYSGDEKSGNPSAKAYERIIVLCSYQDYSREKMRRRLEREKVDSAAADEALDRAVACGLIDDIRYGEALAAGRMRAGKGRQGIENELWENRIDPARIEGWPEEYEARYGDEMQRALRILERNPPRSSRPRESAYRRLCTKGYSGEVASRAASTWWAAHDSARRVD